MTAQSRAPIQDPLTELAAKVYIELICRNVVVTGNAAQINANPENLAKISFKLAEAFRRVEGERTADAAPKNQTFDVQDADLSNWNVPKT